MSPRKPRLLILVALTLPFAAGLVLSLLLRPEAASLLAPFLGPWAGVTYGHHECTLASQSLPAALALAAVGLVALSGTGLLRTRRGYAAVVCVTVLWALTWEASAVLSVANTCI